MALRNAPLRLRFAEGELTISAQSQDVGETVESLPAAYTGEPLEIGFNAEFLADGVDCRPQRHGAAEADQPAPPRPDHVRRRRLVLVPDHADQARRLIVAEVTLRDFRSYARLELALEPGLVLVTGRERRRQDEPARVAARRHAGLLAAHALRHAADPPGRDRRPRRADGPPRDGAGVGLRRASARRSPSAPASTAPCSAPPSSSAASSRRSSSPPTASSSSRAGRPRGAPTSTARSGGSTPRARTSRSTTPPRSASGTPRCGASRMGVSERDVLAPWTAQVADLGAMLTAARRDVIELLQPGFAERAGELGLDDASLGYDAEPPTITLLEERLDARPRAGHDRRRPAPRRDQRSGAATATSGRSARRASSGSPSSRSSSPRRS